MRLASPEFLLLAAALGLVACAWSGWARQRPASLLFPDLSLLPGRPAAGRIKLTLLRGLRLAALALLVLALARPQSGRTLVERRAEGIDIMMALDCSTSMTAEDFHPENRLRVAKDVIQQFVSDRVSDRIGLVIFAGTSFTQCPLTLDYAVLASFVQDVDFAWDWDGTAIGMAIANCLARLKDSDAKSKVIILLTDGVNNRGEIAPLTAAEMARSLGVRIYTIGAGTQGTAPVLVRDRGGGIRRVMNRVEIDEETLESIADTTGGRYFRATDAQALGEIYAKIGAMEKTRIEVKEHLTYTDHFPALIAAGLALLALELALGQIVWRRLP